RGSRGTLDPVLDAPFPAAPRDHPLVHAPTIEVRRVRTTDDEHAVATGAVSRPDLGTSHRPEHPRPPRHPEGAPDLRLLPTADDHRVVRARAPDVGAQRVVRVPGHTGVHGEAAAREVQLEAQQVAVRVSRLVARPGLAAVEQQPRTATRLDPTVI